MLARIIMKHVNSRYFKFNYLLLNISHRTYNVTEINEIPFFFIATSGLNVKHFPFMYVRCSLIIDPVNDLSEEFRKVFGVFPFVGSPSKCRISITSTNSSNEYDISSNSS